MTDHKVLVAEAEALHLRSTTDRHAQTLDKLSQRPSPVEVSTEALKIVLALLDEHEAMNLRLSSRIRSLQGALEKIASGAGYSALTARQALAGDPS
jgi:hypothetical protein